MGSHHRHQHQRPRQVVYNTKYRHQSQQCATNPSRNTLQHSTQRHGTPHRHNPARASASARTRTVRSTRPVLRAIAPRRLQLVHHPASTSTSHSHSYGRTRPCPSVELWHGKAGIHHLHIRPIAAVVLRDQVLRRIRSICSRLHVRNAGFRYVGMFSIGVEKSTGHLRYYVTYSLPIVSNSQLSTRANQTNCGF